MRNGVRLKRAHSDEDRKEVVHTPAFTYNRNISGLNAAV